jgi:hypothetical protein
MSHDKRSKNIQVLSLVVVLGGGLMLGAVSTSAHHSFAAEFDATKPVTLRGVVTRMDWINPHAWIFLNVKDGSGSLVEWAVETAPPNSLIRRGFRKTSLKPGTEIVVNGFRAINGSRTANGYSLTLPDGQTLFLNSSGTGAPEAFPPPRQPTRDRQ